MTSPEKSPGDESQGDEKRTERQKAFVASLNKSVVGARPSLRVSGRGLRGVAVIGSTVAIVVGLVLGGTAAVGAVLSRREAAPEETTTLTSRGLTTSTSSAAPTVPTVSPTAEATAKKAAKAESGTAPARTRTVTQEPAAAASPETETETETGTKTKTKTSEPTQTSAKKAKSGPTVKAIGLIKNVRTKMCVDLPGEGAVGDNVLARQYDCIQGDADNQEFEAVMADDGSFLLRNVKSQWCLDVGGQGEVAAKTEVYTFACLKGDTDNQMFRKEAQGDGFYLVNVKSGLCLDVSSEFAEDRLKQHQKLTLYPCSPDDDHIWTFG